MGSNVKRWEERAGSRRQFLRTTAGVAGGALGAGLLFPTRAWARHHADPRPIPGGITVIIGDEEFFIHHFPSVRSGLEPSEITDFRGAVSNCRILGTGTGTDTRTGEQRPLLFQVDNGFMKGTYIGEDGRRHHGTFAFV